MSVVLDQVRRIDAHVDRVLLNPLATYDLTANSDDSSEDGIRSAWASALSSPRIDELQRLVKTLSTTSETTFSAWRIQDILRQSGLVADPTSSTSPQFAKNDYESELEWILVSKVATQAYGLVLNSLLDQISPLSDHIWYWDQVLSSYTYSSIYTVQTSPIRGWNWSKDVYGEARERITNFRTSGTLSPQTQTAQESLSAKWRQFYGIVRETIAERSLKDLQRRMMSPLALCRTEAKRKQNQLKKLREITASGLGVLIDEGLSFPGEDEKNQAQDYGLEWKGVVERSVALMDLVLKDASDLDVKVTVYEDKVFAGVEDDPELSVHIEDTADKPAIVATRLLNLVQKRLPEHVRSTQSVVAQNGRPSRLVRYWLPAGLLLISSSTLLRILVRRQADILNWVADFGSTIRDFWLNWVVQPVRKVIGTIRHDSNSEIAIMSRDSLKADRDSLERMVVEFAMEKPGIAVGASNITDAQVAEIRAKVKEGDVTPVLRAYERDLKRPLMGAVRGDLVRALLIQVQKTKVDIEIAMSGIDALLKSQELVFGFVGLTPGILVSIGVLSYLPSILGSSRGARRRGQKVGRCTRVLRNIDRILAEVTAASGNVLSYKDHGLLISEIHVLRKLVNDGRLMPRDVEQDFLQDLDDLTNVKGVQAQSRCLERVRWAYSKWLL